MSRLNNVTCSTSPKSNVCDAFHIDYLFQFAIPYDYTVVFIVQGVEVMQYGSVDTRFNRVFDSLECEFITKAGIVSRFRCNIFTIGNRSTGRSVSSNSSRICKSIADSSLNQIKYAVCITLMRCPSG